MPKLDRLKEELAYIRYYISVAITVAIAISGWLVMNIETATWYSIAASHGERTRGLVVPRRRRAVVLSES